LGLELRVQGSGFRVLSSEFRFRFRFLGFRLSLEALRVRVWVRIWDSGLRAADSRFRYPKL
jgi:hypothetical protein